MTRTTMERALKQTKSERASGWHQDPWRLHKERFHDGDEWTESVTHFGPIPCQGCDQHQN
jgi:hypothetical protein